MAGSQLENQSYFALVTIRNIVMSNLDSVNISQILVMWSDVFNNKSENIANFTGLAELPLDMKFNEGHLMAIVMYSCLMFISAIGNGYVFWSLMRLRKHGKLSRINLLLLNLAIADLIVTFVMMPLEISWNATVSWRAGDLLCRLLSFFRVFGLYLSAFVVICICLDRYFAIIKPLAFGEAQNRVKKLLMGAWISSVFSSLPQAFIFHVERHPEFQWYKQCITFNSFPSPEYELAYNLFGFSIMYAIPMASIIYCYFCILWKINTISADKTNETRLRRSTEMLIERAKAKTLKMTLITVIAFSICWTPYNIISLWYWFDKASAMELDQRLQKGFFVFACTNSCVNPLIYGWFHVGAPHKKPSELRINPTHPQHFVCECGDNYSMFRSKQNHQQQPVIQQRHLSEGQNEKNVMMRVIENPCSMTHSSVRKCYKSKSAETRKTLSTEFDKSTQIMSFPHSSRKFLLVRS